MTRAALALCLLVAACTVGPDYQRPAAPAPAAFKEAEGFRPARPADAMDKGAWWQIYQDPELDRLEAMVAVSNQTVKTFEAQYRAATALVAETRAGLFPTLGLAPGATRSNQSSSGAAASQTVARYTLSGTAAWDADLWGRIRRQLESSRAAAEVSAADLANARLAVQASLAVDYFNLRAADALAELLRQTVAAYRRTLEITANQYRAGTTASTDFLTAQAQLEAAQAQLAGVGVARQQYEHAIAVLTGHAPAELTLAAKPLATAVPSPPPGLPSALLERRPDIAAAERAMQQQNALIGVATAGYYPDISLSALGELAGDPLTRMFTLSRGIWSLGAAGTESVSTGGATQAAVANATASYEAAVATYRQSVLTAFQQVEDALSDLRILAQQAEAQARAVASAQRALAATLNAYRAGTVAYTAVVTEQTSLLAAQQTALTIRQARLVDSVALIQALGGGWSRAEAGL